ncbi:hypothetical protein [Brevundimonas sp. SL161]|uniref:hypothetical protein n=1 Tax=Brevundimonas sp. SL161 TaxID=2804613 RepID=UPI003CE78DFB
MNENAGNVFEQEGELFSPTWSFTWIETGATVAPGTIIAPITLPTSAETVEHASLHLASDDLTLARDCFGEALKFGLPDNANSIAKGLIHAAVISYARPFASGVRGFRLTSQFFAAVWTEGDHQTHDYLCTLRDKHVAHSVNDFERATTVGVVVTDQSFHLLGTNPSGVGVTKLSMVGLPMSKLNLCSAHLDGMIAVIEARIAALRVTIHQQTHSLLAVGKRIEMAPLATFADRSKIAERRR